MKNSLQVYNKQENNENVIFTISPYDSDEMLYLVKNNDPLSFDVLSLDVNNNYHTFDPINQQIKDLSYSEYFVSYYKTLKKRILVTLIMLFLVIYMVINDKSLQIDEETENLQFKKLLNI